jgi:hypothetical protein
LKKGLIPTPKQLTETRQQRHGLLKPHLFQSKHGKEGESEADAEVTGGVFCRAPGEFFNSERAVRLSTARISFPPSHSSSTTQRVQTERANT